MATITKKIAENLIKRCRRQSRPKIYCILRYKSLHPGKSGWTDYAVCYSEQHYQGYVNSPFIGGVDILWKNEKFYRNQETKTPR